MSEGFSAIEPFLAEYADIEAEIAEPAAADPSAMCRLERRYVELGRVVVTYRAWQSAGADSVGVRELVVEDEDFAAEVPALEVVKITASEHLREVLVPWNPGNPRGVIIEAKVDEGGGEPVLFVPDLAHIYSRYAERQGWMVGVLDATDSDLGGYKDVCLAIRTHGPMELQDGVWTYLKYEGGVYRVQCVPVTESQGRIHTSAAGVLIMPEADGPGELQISTVDLRIDVFRSSGPGGQSVNTMDSAAHITHLPTGIVTPTQNEKSQLQSKEVAMRVLRARLLAGHAVATAAEAAWTHHSQVCIVDRSERIHTYSFPGNRIADHRIGFKAYSLGAAFDGGLGPVIASAIAMGEVERLSRVGRGSGS